jgi:acetyl-CoA C-acetyltransferase
VDTNSDLPIEMVDQIPRVPSVDEPRTHLSMGQHTERMVKEWQISRQAQDEFALRSHQRAAQAYEQGFFSDLITPFAGLNRDRILRADTSLEKLSRLPAAFEAQGSLTAGNSTALTDGAACVLMGGLKGAEMLGTQPLAKCVDFAVSAVDFVNGEGLLMAPTLAVAQLLQKHRLGFDDFDFIEIHEAFAGQVLANLKAWEDPHYCREVLHLQAPFGQTLGAINPARLNVNGSSLALGHPFAATGARIVGSLAKLLSQSRSQRGLISICTAGGMGMAAILESAD